MPPAKFVDVTLSAIESEVAANLKLKASVLLSPSEVDGKQILECRCEDALVGHICDDDCDGALAFFKREFKVRIVSPAGAAKSIQQPLNPLLVSPELEDLVKDGRMVSLEQYKALAQDNKIQKMLRQQDMQQVLASVDSASSREAELSAALQNPQFSDLCERILDHVSPQV